MSLVRLSRLILVAGLFSLAAVIGGAIYQVNTLDDQHARLEALIALQRDVGSLSVGADAIALFGADIGVMEDYERDALRVQSQLADLVRQLPDASVAINAIDLIVEDLRGVVTHGGAAEMALNGSSTGPGFHALVQLANIANHGIALDAAVSEAVHDIQQDIRRRAWNVSAGLSGLAGLFLFAAVAGFALLHRAIGLPLRELAGTIREIEAGRTERRARVIRDDEVGEVARAFNSLFDKRQQAEARLESPEALLRMAGEIARFGGWSYDARTGQIDRTEETALIHGELPGGSLDLAGALDYYVPEDRSRVAALMERCLRA